jgi:hypothetical protein
MPALAEGVSEAAVFVRPTVRAPDDGVFGHCQSDRGEPLFPLVGGLGFLVGVQQVVVRAEWAAAVLGLNQAQHRAAGCGGTIRIQANL